MMSVQQQQGQPAAGGANVAPFHSASLYVGDLNPDIAEAALFEIFNQVGPVASIRVCRDTVTRRSLGYSYVNFHNVADAERALDTMNFTLIKERPCRIMWSQRDPSLRRSGVGNIFVKNLDTSVDNKALYDTFSLFGNILSCKVATDENSESKGYGYVHYETAEAANEAISKIDGMLIAGKQVHVGHFVRRNDRGGQADWTNIYVKNFPQEWDEDKLKAEFSKFGAITSVKAQTETPLGGGITKGFGFINFETHEAAAAAVEEMNGKKVAMQPAKRVKKVKAAKADKPAAEKSAAATDKPAAAAAASDKDAKSSEESNDAKKKDADADADAAPASDADSKADDAKVADSADKTEAADKPAAAAATDGEKAKPTENGTAAPTDEAAAAADDEDDEPVETETELFCCRAQKKSERARELQHKYEAMKLDRLAKFQGVNLYIKNLDESVTEDQLREAFAPHGTITSCRIMKDGATGNSKGFGFICFSAPEEANKAVQEMNNKMLAAKPIYVAVAQRKEARRAQLEAQYSQQRAGMPGPGRGPMGVGGMGMGMQPGMYGMPYLMQQQQPRPGGYPMMPNMQMMPRGAPRGPMQPYAGGRGSYPMPAYAAMQGGMPGAGPGRGGRGQPMQQGPAGAAAQGVPGVAGQAAGGPAAAAGAQQGQAGGLRRMPPQPGMPMGGPMMGGPMQQGQPVQGGPAGVQGAMNGRPGPQAQMGGPGMQMAGMAQGQGMQQQQRPGQLPGVGMQSLGLPGQRGLAAQQGGPQGGPQGMGQQQGGQQGSNFKYTQQVRNQPGMGGMQQQQQQPGGPQGGQNVMQQGQAQAQQQQPQQQQQAPGPVESLTAQALAAATPEMQKNMIGERLYPLIHEVQPELAGKITGMLLEMDNGELLHLLESPDALKAKIQEALQVLEQHNPAE